MSDPFPPLTRPHSNIPHPNDPIVDEIRKRQAEESATRLIERLRQKRSDAEDDPSGSE